MGRVYRGLSHNSQVSRVVLAGFGGMPQREQFVQLARSSVPMNDAYRHKLLMLESMEREIARTPHAIDQWWLGWPYQRWSSFLRYDPLADLLAIAAPILCIHGSEDASSPVQSSRLLIAELHRIGRTDAVLMEYPGLGHGLNEKAIAEGLEMALR